MNFDLFLLIIHGTHSTSVSSKRINALDMGVSAKYFLQNIHKKVQRVDFF